MRYLYILLTLQILVIIGVIVLLQQAPYPFHTALVRWDAEWYNSIRAHGYFYSDLTMSSVAFFPLFPMVWRVTNLGPIGISLFNLALASASLYMLYRGLHLRPIVMLLFAAFPSSMFLYLPYTEAIFFFFTTLVILLVAQNYKHPVALGAALLGGALTRVAAFFYLPALVIVEGVEWLQDLSSWWVRGRRLFIYGLVTGAGLASVMVYQWSQTGVWFAFNKAETHWDHHLRLPHFPLISTADNDTALWVDGLALTVGLMALVWVLWAVVRVALRRGPAPDRLLLFAAAYIAATTVQTFFHAPLENGHSSLLSLHRYVFCTPFFLVLLEKLLPQKAPSWRSAALVVGGVLVTAAMLGMLSNRQFDIEWPTSKIPFLGGPLPGSFYAAFLMLYGLLWLQTGTRWGRVLVYISSFMLQLFLCYTYAVGHWIG
jgi:hypothetical protein